LHCIILYCIKKKKRPNFATFPNFHPNFATFPNFRPISAPNTQQIILHQQKKQKKIQIIVLHCIVLYCIVLYYIKKKHGQISQLSQIFVQISQLSQIFVQISQLFQIFVQISQLFQILSKIRNFSKFSSKYRHQTLKKSYCINQKKKKNSLLYQTHPKKKYIYNTNNHIVSYCIVLYCIASKKKRPNFATFQIFVQISQLFQIFVQISPPNPQKIILHQPKNKFFFPSPIKLTRKKN